MIGNLHARWHLPLYAASFLGLLILTFVERIIFVAFHHFQVAQLSTGQVGYALAWGLRFDIAVAAFLTLVAYLCAYAAARLLRRDFAVALRRGTYVAATLLVVLHGADLMYFFNANRHLSYETLDWYTDRLELLRTAVTLYPAALAVQLAILAAALAVLHRFLPRRAERPTPWRKNASHRRIGTWLAPERRLVFVLTFSVLLMRGGIQSIPLEPLRAQEIGNAHQAVIALNGAYNALFFSLSSKTVYPVPIAVADDEHIRDVVHRMYPRTPRPAGAGDSSHDYNVVLIFLESWPAAYMKSYGFDRDVTPHFDALRRESLTTLGMLAGGHRTTEGMFATLCSAQNPLGQTVAQTPLANFPYACLPQLLRNRGYSTAFFQGTHKNTSGTGAFAQLLGFAASYGREDIENPRYGYNGWGVHDPDLYRFVLEKIHAMRQPFLVGIDTNTTHDLELPAGVQPLFGEHTRLERNLNVLHFSDQALADFIAAVRRDDSVKPTVFVVLADHTTIFRASNFRNYDIPFLIYAPGIVAPRLIGRVVSQRDVAPTVLQILGLPPTPWFTGKSILRSDDPPYFADYYNSGVLGWIEGPRLVEVLAGNPQRLRCYRYRQDPGQRHPEPCDAEDQAMRRRALAFARVSQDLLFGGRLRQFAALRGGPVPGH